MSDIRFSEACDELIKEIQTEEDYVEAYGLMLEVFFDAIQDQETNRMALSMAKAALKET